VLHFSRDGANRRRTRLRKIDSEQHVLPFAKPATRLSALRQSGPPSSMLNNGHAATDSNVFYFRRFLRPFINVDSGPSVTKYKVVLPPTGSGDGVLCVSTKTGCGTEDSSPTNFPKIVFARDRELGRTYATRDPGTAARRIVVGAFGPTVLPVHLPEYLGFEEPSTQFHFAGAERIVDGSPTPSSKPVQQNQKCRPARDRRSEIA